MEHKHLKSMVRSTMERGLTDSTGWTLQGLGMLRFYYSTELRLHVWDDRFITMHGDQRPSELHTHPWHLTSTIIAGQLVNRRFETPADQANRVLSFDDAMAFKNQHVYQCQKLHCGTGGGLIGEPNFIFLKECSCEVYDEGESYYQHATEIHMSRPVRGTVTLIQRDMTDNPDHAFVFWQGNQGFLSAEPRPATLEETKTIIEHSLNRWKWSK